MICPNCRKKLNPNARFCKYCGSQISVKKENSTQQNTEKNKSGNQVLIVISIVMALVICTLIGLLITGQFFRQNDDTEELKPQIVVVEEVDNNDKEDEQEDDLSKDEGQRNEAAEKPEPSNEVEYVSGGVVLSNETTANADLYPKPERTLTYSSVKIMVGDDVKYIQAALIEMNYTGLSVSGYYDEETISALKRFQKNHGYSQNDTVDSTMVANIAQALKVWREKNTKKPSTASSEYVGSSTTSSSSSSSSSSANADYYPIPSRDLKKGMSGDDVKYVQAALKEMNYSGLAVDGDFGTYTEDAVKRFQRNHDLYVDGIVGPKTTAEIQSALSIWRRNH